jgi:hypothetical protein
MSSAKSSKSSRFASPHFLQQQDDHAAPFLKKRHCWGLLTPQDSHLHITCFQNPLIAASSCHPTSPQQHTGKSSKRLFSLWNQRPRVSSTVAFDNGISRDLARRKLIRALITSKGWSRRKLPSLSSAPPLIPATQKYTFQHGSSH